MLEPRFTEGDIVVYQFNFSEITFTGIIEHGPYREGIWWEYEMRDGSLVRDGEISHLIGRVPSCAIDIDSGL